MSNPWRVCETFDTSIWKVGSSIEGENFHWKSMFRLIFLSFLLHNVREELPLNSFERWRRWHWEFSLEERQSIEPVYWPYWWIDSIAMESVAMDFSLWFLWLNNFRADHEEHPWQCPLQRHFSFPLFEHFPVRHFDHHHLRPYRNLRCLHSSFLKIKAKTKEKMDRMIIRRERKKREKKVQLLFFASSRFFNRVEHVVRKRTAQTSSIGFDHQFLHLTIVNDHRITKRDTLSLRSSNDVSNRDDRTLPNTALISFSKPNA